MKKEPTLACIEPQRAASLAIDWADRKHVWKSQPAGSELCEQGELEQTPEAIEVWASQLATRFEGLPLAVALERPRGAVMLSAPLSLSGTPRHIGAFSKGDGAVGGQE